MNKNLLIFFIAALLFCSDLIAQRNYRVRIRNSKNPTIYVLPPYTNLRFKNDGSAPRKRFKYYYILLSNLSNDNNSIIQSLENAEIWNDNLDYWQGNSKKKLSLNIKSLKSNCGTCDCKLFDGTGYKGTFLLCNGSKLFIQISYDLLTKNNQVENFNKLIIDLVHDISSLEEEYSCGCTSSIKLPTGFAHQLVKRLKEWIPLPAELPQPGTCFTEVCDQSDFLLLDEDLTLKVDSNIKVIIPSPSGNDDRFQYDWKGANLYSFRRASDGTPIENAFGDFKNGLPSNQIGDHLFKLASFADIQSSGALRGRYYIGLYHPPLKRNNNRVSGTGQYSPADDEDPLVGNAFLLHFNSTEMSNLDFSQAFGSSDTYTKSIFSERGSIEPLIKIFINNQESLQSILIKSSDIKSIPVNHTLKRKYGKGYRKVKGYKNIIFLLPYDHIKYKP